MGVGLVLIFLILKHSLKLNDRYGQIIHVYLNLSTPEGFYYFPDRFLIIQFSEFDP